MCFVIRGQLSDALSEDCPPTLQASTKVKLGATAGLRLLPGGKADLILDKVREYLRASPFLLDEAAGVTILDGATLHCCVW